MGAFKSRKTIERILQLLQTCAKTVAKILRHAVAAKPKKQFGTLRNEILALSAPHDGKAVGQSAVVEFTLELRAQFTLELPGPGLYLIIRFSTDFPLGEG